MRERATRAFFCIAGVKDTTNISGENMFLFKIVTDRDDVIIGLSPEQLHEGVDAGAVGRMIVQNGHLTAWQYVVSRNDAGELVHAPRQWISVLAHNSIRVEPYESALPVTLPGK